MISYQWVRHLFSPVSFPSPPPFASGNTTNVNNAFAVYIDDLLGGVRTTVDPTSFNNGDVYTWRFRFSDASGDIKLADIEWRYTHSTSGSSNLEARSYDDLLQPGSYQPQLSFLRGGNPFAFDTLMDLPGIKSGLPALILENAVLGQLNITYEQTLNGNYAVGPIVFSPILDSQNQTIGYNHTASSPILGTGGFDLRGLAISNLRVEEPIFNPSEGPARVKGDILALPVSTSNYPSGWTPATSVQSFITVHSGMALVEYLLAQAVGTPIPLPGIFEVLSGTFALGSFSTPGKVAEIDIEWDGAVTISGLDIPLNGLAGLHGDCGAPTAENDNFMISKKKDTFSLLYNCSEKSGCKTLTCPTGLPVQNGDPGPTHTSCQFLKGTSSFGYGWNSIASERIIEDTSGNLTYKTSSGAFLRWNLDGTDYVPAFPGNYTEASKNPASTDARYVLTFKDQSVLEFNSDGRLKRSLDRNNNQMVYTYNGTTGFLEEIDDLRGRTLYYDYGTRTDGQPVSIRANNPTTGRQTQFEYISSSDPNVPDRLQKVIDPEGNETEFSYYPSGLMETVTDPRGIVSNRFFYDSFNRIQREVIYDEAEMEYVYGHDSSSGLDFVEIYQRDLAVTNPEPDRYTYTLYDPFGSPILMADLVDDSGTTPVFNVTEMFYNDPNSPYLMTARRDPNLTVVAYEYDAAGNVTKTIDKDGNETLYAYADTVDSTPINPKHRNLVRFITRPDVTVNGVLTSYNDTELRYDSNGNLEKVIDARLKETMITYTSDGLIETVEDRRGNTSEFVYEGTAFDGTSSRNLLQVKVPKGLVPADGFRTVTMTYDDYDNVATMTNDLGHQMTNLYDDLDRPDTVTDARGKITSFFYQDDLLDEIHLPANNGSSSNVRKTTMSYDNSSRLTQVDRDVATTGPQELRVKYRYSSFSQLKELIRIKNGVERSFEMSFDQLGRQTSMKDPTAEESTVAFAPFCVEQAQTSARGIRRRVSYDNRCLLTQVAVGDPDGSDPLELSVTRELRTFIYDELGRLGLSAQDRGNGDPSDPDFGIPYTEGVTGIDKYVEVGTNVRFYLYDELDRLTELTYEDGRSASWEYDDEGNVTKFTDPDGKVTRYEYYRDHLLYRVIVERPSQADRVFTYFYDDAGR
ncbi:MAG TPA: RHS repeat protein, partial [Phycisphaerales bacterium]|nr:RHS repeat protein [Phycisphaerales bacterium]